MNTTLKYFAFLISLIALLLLTGAFLLTVYKLNISFPDILITSAAFSAISIITFLLFIKGLFKEPDSQTLYILMAICLKFLLEIVLSLIWFIVAKKTSLHSVLMFFVLYLTLTLFTIVVILKTLKNKAL